MNRDKDILGEVKTALDELVNLRPLGQTIEKADFPLNVHAPLDPQFKDLQLKIGEWTPTPWESVKCFGISLSESEVVILCELSCPIKFPPHEHGEWAERLVLDTGCIYEATHDKFYYPGNEIYRKDAGEFHAPYFIIPSRCLITWTKK